MTDKELLEFLKHNLRINVNEKHGGCPEEGYTDREVIIQLKLKDDVISETSIYFETYRT